MPCIDDETLFLPTIEDRLIGQVFTIDDVPVTIRSAKVGGNGGYVDLEVEGP